MNPVSRLGVTRALVPGEPLFYGTFRRKPRTANENNSKQKPGPNRPGFCSQKTGRSGGRLEQLRRAGLERLDGIVCHLAGQLGEFLALGREGFKLRAGMAGPQLDRLGRRFHGGQRLRKIQSRGRVGLHDVQQLGGVLARALAS